jgi:catechol 2,3-dioxygenase-like lactoylglutathione lyase family enzyme
MLKYEGALIAVQDIAVSRRFYEECLEQKVKFDFNVDVSYEGGLTLHQKDHFQDLLGGERFPVLSKAHSGELYFETDDLDLFERRLQSIGTEFIHPVREQPWGQRVMRFYDPDGHVIEIGESMQAVVRRFHHQARSVESICQQTGMPRPFVEDALGAG